MTTSLAGGCLCGAIRYEATSEPLGVVLCHCAYCRRASGAPAVAWFTVPLDDLKVVAGTPTAYASSQGVVRSFCGCCGTQLIFTAAGYLPGLADVTVCSLDEPEKLPYQAHIWTTDRLPWFDTTDSQPRHPEFHPAE
jgi:hypothetical protein